MYTNSSDSSGFLLAAGASLLVIVYAAVLFAACALVLVSLWKVFVKAGEPGWAALVPIYNYWVIYKISCKNNVMWFIFMFIPFLNLVSFVVSLIGLCKAFNKGTAFIVVSVLLMGLTIPFLAFGKAEYNSENRI